MPIGIALTGYPTEDPQAERAKRAFRERRRPDAQLIRSESWRLEEAKACKKPKEEYEWTAAIARERDTGRSFRRRLPEPAGRAGQPARAWGT
jgi:hypothetical protein